MRVLTTLLAGIALAAVVAGCSRREAAPGASQWVSASEPFVTVAPRPYLRPQGAPIASAPVDTRGTPIDQLTPVDSGAGVVVAEPVAEGAAPAIAQFGAGCARWLFYAVGGCRELGKTPRWWSIQRAVEELGRHDFRLGASEAKRLYHILGATHVAVGRVAGDDRRCTLTYELLTLPDLTPVGAPLVGVGTPAEVSAGLPAMVAAICTRCGAPIPLHLGPPPESVEDLAFLGRTPWVPERLAAPQRSRLALLAARSPIAALAYICALTAMRDDQTAGSLVNNMARQWEHPVMLAEIARAALRAGRLPDREVHRDFVAHVLARSPNNNLLHVADALFDDFSNFQGRLPDARRAAEKAVRCAPRDPDAWLVLGDVVYGAAARIRRARSMDALSPADLQASGELYAQALPIRRRVVDLDPSYGDGWRDLATTAAFAGDATLADHAFWKAVQFERGNPYLYAWGLEMYQPKWFPDEAKRAKVARLAAREHYDLRADRLYMAKILYNEGYPALGRALPLQSSERAVLDGWLKRNHPELSER